MKKRLVLVGGETGEVASSVSLFQGELAIQDSTKHLLRLRTAVAESPVTVGSK